MATDVSAVKILMLLNAGRMDKDDFTSLDTEKMHFLVAHMENMGRKFQMYESFVKCPRCRSRASVQQGITCVRRTKETVQDF